MLIVAMLDPMQFEYSVAEIAPLLNLSAKALHPHCRDLWPHREERYYRFDFCEAAILIYRVSRDGRKLPDRNDLHRQLLDDKTISESFPDCCPHVKKAADAIMIDRERRAALRAQRVSQNSLQTA